MVVQVARVEEMSAWSTLAVPVDESKFVQGRIGPYRLGPLVRRTAFGEIVLALQDERLGVVELDVCASLAGTALTAHDGALMNDLAEVVGLQHRHIATIIGSGFDEGVPYIVRHHHLGVTLEQLLESKEEISPSLAVAVLHAAAEALEFLSRQGSKRGACSLGGFDARDVFLGYDGRILLVGLGLKSARVPTLAPTQADLQSCFELARQLDEASEARLTSAIAAGRSLKDLVRAARRRDPEACGDATRHVAAALRLRFADRIREERAFFGLSALH
jgi:hypothetical protein